MFLRVFLAAVVAACAAGCVPDPIAKADPDTPAKAPAGKPDAAGPQDPPRKMVAVPVPGEGGAPDRTVRVPEKPTPAEVFPPPPGAGASANPDVVLAAQSVAKVEQGLADIRLRIDAMRKEIGTAVPVRQGLIETAKSLRAVLRSLLRDIGDLERATKGLLVDLESAGPALERSAAFVRREARRQGRFPVLERPLLVQAADLSKAAADVPRRTALATQYLAYLADEAEFFTACERSLDVMVAGMVVQTQGELPVTSSQRDEVASQEMIDKLHTFLRVVEEFTRAARAKPEPPKPYEAPKAPGTTTEKPAEAPAAVPPSPDALAPVPATPEAPVPGPSTPAAPPAPAPSTGWNAGPKTAVAVVGATYRCSWTCRGHPIPPEGVRLVPSQPPAAYVRR